MKETDIDIYEKYTVYRKYVSLYIKVSCNICLSVCLYVRSNFDWELARTTGILLALFKE